MSHPNLRRKILACWTGKAIGGTLGTPHEGKTGPLDLDFYRPVPTGLLPNDDLDLQIVWIHHLRTGKIREITPKILSEAWEKHVLFPFDEYSVVRRNRRLGLIGVTQGPSDNYFSECMGAAIRSEVWACLAPGDPGRAAGFAWADAVVDHAGDGVWAAVFHAALQSAAFSESDPERLIDVALGFVPRETRLHRALRDTMNWWRAQPDWLTVRSQILERYATGNFTDVVCNLCFELLAWFDGAGDFGRSICTAVNCGLDTDCTAATIGSLLGILDPDSIPERWRAPIGRDIVLSKEIVFVSTPRDLDQLTDWTLEVATLVKDAKPAIGAIPPRAPENDPDGIHALCVELSHEENAHLLDSKVQPALTQTRSQTLGGTWTQWAAADFEQEIILLRTTFEIEPGVPPELMVFYTADAAAWVEGRRVISISGDQVNADPFIGPSFHRAGPAVVELELDGPGPFELVVGLKRPSDGRLADLVLGLADHRTHLWLPEALKAHSPGKEHAGMRAG